MKTTNNYLKSASIAVASLTLLMTAGNAAVLFSDDFTGVTDATLNAYGYYFYSGNGGSNFMIATDNTAPLSGNTLCNPGGTSFYSGALKQFATTTLSSVGDSLTLSVDYHTQNAGGYSWFTFSLLNSAFVVSADSHVDTGIQIPDAVGYTFAKHGDSATVTKGEILKQTAGSNYNGAGSWLADPSPNNFADGAAHTMTMSLTKVLSGTTINWSVDGISLGSVTDASYNTFNTFRLQDGVTGSWTYVDNISAVTNAVPEPSALAMLLAAGGLGLLCARRLSRTRESSRPQS